MVEEQSEVERERDASKMSGCVTLAMHYKKPGKELQKETQQEAF
jgi:hypothetical protein